VLGRAVPVPEVGTGCRGEEEGSQVKLLLHSGGCDSQVCWLLDRTLKPVYVAHGAQNQGAEIKALGAIASLDPSFRPYTVHSVRCKAEFDGHIPYRNALLLVSALAAFPEAESITYGALLGEGSGDKSAAFARHLAAALSIGEGRQVRILRPLRHLTKARALRLGLSLPGSHTLTATTSCYSGTECGHCQACFRLGIALYLNGLRGEPPELPLETKGVRATLRTNQLRRWPALALANADVVHAYTKYRVKRVRSKLW
jgi:hypothetical protein